MLTTANGTRLPFTAPQKLWQLLRGQADISVAMIGNRKRGARLQVAVQQGDKAAEKEARSELAELHAQPFNTSQPDISVPHADAHLVLDARQLAGVVDNALQVGDDGLADPCGAGRQPGPRGIGRFAWWRAQAMAHVQQVVSNEAQDARNFVLHGHAQASWYIPCIFSKGTELSELRKQTRMMARPEAAKISLACGLMGLVAGVAVCMAVPNTATFILTWLLPLSAGFWSYCATIRHLTR